MSYRPLIRFFASTLLVGAACRDTGAPTGSGTLSIVKAPGENGDLQHDTVLSTLAPLRVLVRDDVAPAIGAPVYWTIALDTIVTRSIAMTDRSGIASLALTFGAKAAVYNVTATVVQGASAPAITFTLTSTAGHPSALRAVSGANQSDTARASLGGDYVVQVQDAHGNPVADVGIDWAITAGDGLISPARSFTTAPNGYAAARYRLGSIAGVNTVTATLAGLDTPVTFDATATPAHAALLKMVAGNNQTGPTDAVLTSDYIVQCTDSYGNAAAGMVVDWTITAGGGSLSSTRTTTGSDGMAATRAMLGPSGGVQTVTASVSTLPSTQRATFTATAIAPPPPPPPPSTSLQVTVSTSGAEFPGDFGLGVQECSHYPDVCGADRTFNVIANATTTINLPPGDYGLTLLIGGFLRNCTAAANSQAVTVRPGMITEVAFYVVCVRTGEVRVSASITGADGGTDYDVGVDGEFSIGPLFAGGSISIRLGAGPHTIALIGVPTNCTVTGANPVNVTVAVAAATDVVFPVSCAPNARRAWLALGITTERVETPHPRQTAVLQP